MKMLLHSIKWILLVASLLFGDAIPVGARQPLALPTLPVPAQHPPLRAVSEHLSGTWTSMWSLGFLVLKSALVFLFFFNT